MSHLENILSFYYPRCLNKEDGGYFNEYQDDGKITDRKTQHIVSTTRFVFVFSLASLIFKNEDHKEAAAHGLKYLIDCQQDHKNGGYYWIMDGRIPRDNSKQCYGHAFVLLAFACAVKAKIAGAAEALQSAFEILEKKFWSPKDRLYAEEFSRDWKPLSRYRGQNANMHMTEAMIAAYEATGDKKYLDRAETLAERICVDLAAQANGLVWEHYREDWSVDWDYNKSDPKNLFRPYGYLPGHFTEWTKLLLVLERYRPRDWMLPTATHLYDVALARSADLAHGGMHYSFGPDGQLCDVDKYHWVHCETIAAAACLAVRTKKIRFWQDYDHLWRYSWLHLIDQKWGCWYRITTPDGKRYDDLKSPPAKTDYHPFGAVFEVLRTSGQLMV